MKVEDRMLSDPKVALILVDIQNDFLPGGALPVPKGDEVIEVANRLIERSRLTVATQDWHPPEHGSFASQHSGADVGRVIQLDGLSQILWPDHCVQNSGGAEFASDLAINDRVAVFQKGTDPLVDSYSGFFDNGHRKETGLGQYLKDRGVHDVYVMGLATDYCVKFTALDARQLGFEVFLIEDGCRGVNRHATDVDEAINELCEAGVRLVQSQKILG